MMVVCVCAKNSLLLLFFGQNLATIFSEKFPSHSMNGPIQMSKKFQKRIRQINQTPKKDDICGIFYGRFGRICCAIAASDFMYILHTCMLPM